MRSPTIQNPSKKSSAALDALEKTAAIVLTKSHDKISSIYPSKKSLIAKFDPQNEKNIERCKKIIAELYDNFIEIKKSQTPTTTQDQEQKLDLSQPLFFQHQAALTKSGNFSKEEMIFRAMICEFLDTSYQTKHKTQNDDVAGALREVADKVPYGTNQFRNLTSAADSAESKAKTNEPKKQKLEEEGKLIEFFVALKDIGSVYKLTLAEDRKFRASPGSRLGKGRDDARNEASKISASNPDERNAIRALLKKNLFQKIVSQFKKKPDRELADKIFDKKSEEILKRTSSQSSEEVKLLLESSSFTGQLQKLPAGGDQLQARLEALKKPPRDFAKELMEGQKDLSEKPLSPKNQTLLKGIQSLKNQNIRNNKSGLAAFIQASNVNLGASK